jgi:hypothetical protein
MADEPIDLDEHRGMSARKATEVRRELHDVGKAQAALRARQEELESFLATEPVKTLPELAAKLRYLLELYGATADGQNARRKTLIASALDDLTRLLGA